MADPITVYAEDADLLLIRPDILSLGEASWDEMHTEAFAVINRAIDVMWYRSAAAERGLSWYASSSALVDLSAYPFDPALLLSAATQLKRLGCFKAFELIYAALTKGTEDVFANLRDYYAGQYEAELKAVAASGLDYDWDEGGTLADSEKSEPAQPRRLVRG
jgi:hypothetical protein